MTFSINTIRSTFTRTSTSTANNSTYLNTSFSNTRILNAPSITQTTPVQQSFVKRLTTTSPSTNTNIPILAFTGTTAPTITAFNNQPSQPIQPTQIINTTNTTSAAIVSGSGPSGIIPLTSGETTSGVSLSSSFFGETFFSSTSLFFLPTRLDLLESFTGQALTDEEKPRILASILENVKTDGFGRKNSLIIKKLKSSRATVSYYRIFKKNMFEDLDFREIVRIPADTISVDPKYNDLLLSLVPQINDAFIFSDEAININNIYIYKVQAEWYLNAPKNPHDLIVAALPNVVDAASVGFINIL